jgi:hypothetical protein
MNYQIPRYLNEQVRFVGLQSDEFIIALLSVYFLCDLSFSMDGSISQHCHGGWVYLAEPQFSQGLYPASGLFQRVLYVFQLSRILCQQVY